jgi:hypothetical protein
MTTDKIKIEGLAMAKKPTTKNNDAQIEVQEIEMVEIDFFVLGTTPLIMNRFNQKAWHELLLPSLRRNQADLEQSLKHDPVGEFRGAMYRNRDPKAASLVHIPNGAFHGCVASAALDIPGATKSKIERLTRIADVNINLFGLPQLFMAMVRNSDMNRTPDVRTRPLFPEWACKITIRYVRKILSERTVANLLGAAGMIVGIGDWRGQKGGPYGAFRLVAADNADFKRITKTMGRVPQQQAFDRPVPHDEDTEELLAWFHAEVARREQHLPSQPAKTKRVILERGGNGAVAGEYVGTAPA